MEGREDVSLEMALEVKLWSEERDPVENYRLDIPAIEAIEVRQVMVTWQWIFEEIKSEYSLKI
jgi:hypothetical protein